MEPTLRISISGQGEGHAGWAMRPRGATIRQPSIAATVPPSEWPPTIHREMSGWADCADDRAPREKNAMPSGCLTMTTVWPASASGRSTAA